MDNLIQDLLEEFILEQRGEIEQLKNPIKEDEKDYHEIPPIEEFQIRFHIIKHKYPGKFNTDITGLNKNELHERYLEIIDKIKGYQFTYDEVKQFSESISNLEDGSDNLNEQIREILPEGFQWINNLEEDYQQPNTFFDFITKSLIMCLDYDITEEKRKEIRNVLTQLKLMKDMEKLECCIL